MAFTKFKTKDLARSAIHKKSRRRRIVFLSTSNPQSFDNQHRRPSTKNKPSLSAMAEPIPSPKMDSKTTSISSAQESQPKSKKQSTKPLKKTRPEINLIKKEQEASSETSESSNSSTKTPSIFDRDEENGKPGPVDTPPSSPASEIALDSEKKKQPKKEEKQESKTTAAAVDAKPKKRPVDQAKSDHPQKSSKLDSAKPQVSTSRKDSEKSAKTAGKPSQKKKTEMATAPLDRAQFLNGLDRSWPNPNLGGRGLINPGPLCYRRAVLQCLLNIPVFVNWLSNHHITSRPSQCPGTSRTWKKGKEQVQKAQACLACALIKLSKAYWEPQGAAQLVEATRFFDRTMMKIGMTTACFPAGLEDEKHKKERRNELQNEQQDAAEFFRWILGALEQHGQMQGNEINSIFQHCIRKEKRCPECNHRTSSDLINNHLLLSIDNAKRRDSLESMITEHLRAERLPQVSCDNDECKYNDRQEKRLNMSRRTTGMRECPEILVIQINRSGWSGSQSRKMLNPVTFPPVLDLTSRLDPDVNETTAKYSLSGVVRHEGASLTFGHYLGRSITPKGVRELNDSDVKGETLRGLLNPKGKGTETPYLLFYTRLHDDEQSPLSQLGGGDNPPGNTKSTSTKSAPSKNGKATSSTGNSNAAPRSGNAQKKRKLSDASQSSPKKQKKNQRTRKL